jgi:hypothetical protein
MLKRKLHNSVRMWMCTALCCLLASAVAAAAPAAAAAAQDYTQAGPCAVQKVAAGPQIMPKETGCKLQACLLKVMVTLPRAVQAAGSKCPAGPFPIVFFYSAFQVCN